MTSLNRPMRVVITGAGSGLGRAVAMRYARDGARIAVTDADLDRAEQTLASVRAAGADGFALRCDVREANDYARVAARLDEDWSGVDIVVNNAGVGSAGTAIDTAPELWQWTLDINLYGVVRGIQALAPLLVRQHSGHVVNVASFAGIANAPAMAAYNTAKAGVIGLSESLRCELAIHGVGVSVACPAFFRTRLMEGFRTADPRLEKMAARMFERSDVSADDVAADIHRAVRDNRFMVITHREARWLYRLKRLAPETFHRLVCKRAAGLIANRSRE